MDKITQSTLIPLGLAITFATVVFSAGVLYNKVETSLSQIGDVKHQVARLEEKVDRYIIRVFSAADPSLSKTSSSYSTSMLR